MYAPAAEKAFWEFAARVISGTERAKEDDDALRAVCATQIATGKPRD